MKKIMMFFVLCAGSIVSAQSTQEQVVRPVYIDEDFGVIGGPEKDVVNSQIFIDPNISENLVVNPDISEQENQEITITTELGTTTIIQATSSPVQVEEIESLEDVVGRLNERYETQKANCETGSWFARIWCRLLSWFGF